MHNALQQDRSMPPARAAQRIADAALAALVPGRGRFGGLSQDRKTLPVTPGFHLV